MSVLLTGALSFVLGIARVPLANSTSVPSRTAEPNNQVFVFQNNFWINLHHFLRAEALRRGRGLALQLPSDALNPEEHAAWQSALEPYAGLAKRAYIFDETLTRMDNALAKPLGPAIDSVSGIDPEFVAALNRAAPIYRAHWWKQVELQNQEWIAAHAAPIEAHAPAIRTAIGKVFRITPPTAPILVDIVPDVGLNLAFTTAGPEKFSGHTFISPQANASEDVALDTIFHEISHTMDDPIISRINAEAARQNLKIPEDLWHAMTLYTTYHLVLFELGRKDDAEYTPHPAFVGMFAQGAWHAIYEDLQANWLPYLKGQGDLNQALAAVVQNAPHNQER